MLSKLSTMDGNYTIPDVSKKFENIANNKILLDISAIKQLQVITQFKQLRFECFKPSVNRRVDIATLDNAKGHAVINFFLFQNTTPPLACGTYKTLPNDNSKLGAVCSLWYGKTWAKSGKQATSKQMYEWPFFVSGKNYFLIGNNGKEQRWRCDDYSFEKEPGEWKRMI